MMEQMENKIIPQSSEYRALHYWLNRNMPRKRSCEHCGTFNKKLEIACKEGKYTKNFSDYMFLCHSCHIYHDMKPDTKLKQSLAKIGKPSWNKGTAGKGIMKPNKTSFKKGVPPPAHKRCCKCFRCHKN